MVSTLTRLSRIEFLSDLKRLTPQIMPAALQAISYIIPQYYFFTSIRLMLTGWTIPMILPYLLILGLMCAVILPLGYGVYAWCLKTARKNGTLSWF